MKTFECEKIREIRYNKNSAKRMENTVFFPYFMAFNKREKPHYFHKFIGEVLKAKTCKSKLDLLRARNVVAECLDYYSVATKFIDRRKKLVVIVGDPILYFYRSNMVLSSKGRIFTKFALKLVDLFIAVGDLNAKLLDEMGFDNYIKVYPFVEVEKQKELVKIKPMMNSKIVLTIVKGGHDPRTYMNKGLDILEKVAGNLPEFNFVVIGTSLKSEVRNLNYRGWKKDIIPYIKSALISLVPSRYDSFSVSGLECMTAGLPVITTPTNGLSFFNIRDLVAHDAKEIIKKIRWFKGLSKEEKLVYSRCSRKLAGQFSRNRFIEEFTRQWRSTTGKNALKNTWRFIRRF